MVLARLLTQTGTGNDWKVTALCVLEKRMVKIKTLLNSLSANAQVVMQDGESALDAKQGWDTPGCWPPS